MMVNSTPLYLRKMTSPEICKFVKVAPIVILPVGSIEQHGSHLPIDTDLMTIEYIAEESLKAVRNETSLSVGTIAPSLPYGGPGIGMEAWPGTVTLKPSTLIDVIYDVGTCLISSGFRYIVVLNGCYGNIPTLTLAVQKLKHEHPQPDFILVGSCETVEVINKVRTSASGGIGHACEFETSTSLVIDPNHVQMDKAEPGHLQHPSDRVSFDFDQVSPFYWPYDFRKMAPNGVIGDPTQGTAEKGRVILEDSVKRIADILRHIIEIDKRR
jgi:creatinine amidohydrolase